MTLPTPRTTQAAHATVTAICATCQHAADLDLAALIAAGRGDMPLPGLRLVCRACGSQETRVAVSGRR